MPTEITLETISFLEKCYIYWKTKNYGRRIEHIALMLSVAIYMNKNIYEEELDSAREYLKTFFKDEVDVNNIMEYVVMRLKAYQDEESVWLEDRQEAFNLIIKDEELYGCMGDIFNADDKFDESEEIFEEALKRLL